MPLLELKGVSKGFGVNGSRHEVLADVNFTAEEGEFVAIVGYSGSGKTTLISMLAGLVKPDTGAALMNGEPIKGPAADRAIVFQNYSLLPWMTVEQNVALAVDKVFAKESATARNERVLKALAMVNLSHAVEKKPSELSGGMRQRVSVARALSMDPRVLLLDEPLGALDALTRATIQDEIEQIWARDRKTVVLITNDVDEAILLADRIIPLSMGPGASLGPSVTVDIPRPRDRKAMNHDARFRAVRQQVIEWLLGPGRRGHAAPKPAAPRKTIAPAAGPRPIDMTFGFVPLTDCAPFVVAFEKGLFKKHGVNATLRKMPSWQATIDGLSSGELHGAHLLLGVAAASAVGLLGSRKSRLIAPWVLNRNGQGVTIASSFKGRVAADARAMVHLVGPSSTFGVTHPHGTHAMLLRYWLAAGGVNPDRDVTLRTVPPPQMVAGLRSGDLAGCCVGEPWNAKAVFDGVGYTAVASQDIWPDHPEKICAFTEEYADAHPGAVKAVCRALHEASVWLDNLVNAAETAVLLSRPQYVDCPADLFAPRLRGRYEFGDGRKKDYGDRGMTFSRRGANRPQAKHAAWFLTQFVRWGMLEREPDYAAVARRVMRGDLFEQAMCEAGHPCPEVDESPEMFFDGVRFDPAIASEYAKSFTIHSMNERPAGGGGSRVAALANV